MEQRINHIIVGYDFSDGATRALEASLWLARRVKGSVRAVTAVSGGARRETSRQLRQLGARDPLEIEAIMLEEVANMVKERVSELDIHDVVVTYEVGEKRPEALLRESADVFDGDLIAVGAVGHEHEHDVPIGTDTFRLIRHSMWPVLVMKRDQAFPPRRILVAVDMSDASERALGWAVDIARLTDAELTVMHVLEGKTTESDFAAYLESRDTSRVRSVERVVRGGVAHREISGMARDGYDLLVIGSLGRSKVVEFMIGGTTERVLRELPCSMLFVKPVAYVLKL